MRDELAEIYSRELPLEVCILPDGNSSMILEKQNLEMDTTRTRSNAPDSTIQTRRAEMEPDRCKIVRPCGTRVIVLPFIVAVSTLARQSRPEEEVTRRQYIRACAEQGVVARL